MLKKCYRCYRPVKSCYCRYIVSMRTGVKFVFLMHPKEAFKQKTGTGRLAHLALEDSELIIGIDFSAHPRVNAFLKDPAYFPVLLYPGTEASDITDPAFRLQAESRKLLIFILDATWPLARKIMRLSSNLHGLPRLSFRTAYRSQFAIKQQPSSYCLSTIESVYYLICELKDSGLIDNQISPEGLMAVFHRMVNYQLAYFKFNHKPESEQVQTFIKNQQK